MRSYWVNWKAVINWLEAGCNPPWFMCIAQCGSAPVEPYSFLAVWGSPAAQLLIFFSYLAEYHPVPFPLSVLAAAMVIALYSCILHNHRGINRSPFKSLYQQFMFCVLFVWCSKSARFKTSLFHSPLPCIMSKLLEDVLNIKLFARDRLCPLHIKTVINAWRKLYMLYFSYYLETLTVLSEKVEVTLLFQFWFLNCH